MPILVIKHKHSLETKLTQNWNNNIDLCDELQCSKIFYGFINKIQRS